MKLRIVRIFFSVCTLFLFLLIFIGSSAFSQQISILLLKTQVIPTFIVFITSGSLSALFFLISIVIMTLIFGRVYCSFLCPLGVMQDFIAFLQQKTGLNNKYPYHSPANNKIRFGSLVVLLITISNGSLALLNWLDPYSVSGRIFSHIIIPPLYYFKNLMVSFGEQYDLFYWQYAFTTKFRATTFVSTSLFVLILVILVFKQRRLFCSSLCPIGTILGIFSKYSKYQFQINQKQCVGCHACSNVCNADCIDHQAIKIDMSQCVVCFNCISVCEQQAIQFQSESFAGTDQSMLKRDFLKLGIWATAGFIISPFSKILSAQGSFENSSVPIMPPGAIGVEHFASRCTGCNLCVQNCVSECLRPGFNEFGYRGLQQSVMNFNEGYCAYDCNSCGEVCPTGAILVLGIKKKQRVKIGDVILFEKACIIYQEKKVCGACLEACPTQAISYAENDNVLSPKVNNAICNGCGFCQYVCPVEPKAIQVFLVSTHKLALAPKQIEKEADHLLQIENVKFLGF